MRPSSSPSDGLFSALLCHGPVAAEVDGAAWLRALLDTEAALARATASVGLVPHDAAQGVVDACADASAYDQSELGHSAALGGNPVIPLVRAIEERAGAGGAHVHHGATSQDVLDTAMMLVAARARAALSEVLRACVAAAAELAARHRDTVVSGRTLMQHAVPTTFGLKAVGWATALQGCADRLAAIQLPVQLGGAAGTLASYAGRGREVSSIMAADLGLASSPLPWHTARLPVADLAGALGTTAGAVSKTALDVVLLAQTEVGEVREGHAGAGGSSAMPHKRNPVAAVQARAAARRAPGLVATLLSCMEQEHERAAGAWHAEWVPLSDLLASTGTAAAWLRESLEALEVDVDRMRANLDDRASEAAAAPVAEAITPLLGRAGAHDLVAEAIRTARATGTSLRAVLLRLPDLSQVLTPERLDQLLEMTLDVGEAGSLVDDALRSLPSAATSAR